MRAVDDVRLFLRHKINCIEPSNPSTHHICLHLRQMMNYLVSIQSVSTRKHGENLSQTNNAIRQGIFIICGRLVITRKMFFERIYLQNLRNMMRCAGSSASKIKLGHQGNHIGSTPNMRMIIQGAVIIALTILCSTNWV